MTLDATFKAAKAGDLTNDTTYKVGEISRKTGLQKQPDGSWAPPKGQAKKPLTRQDNTILGGQAGRTLNNNVQATGPERDVSAENRAYHEKVEKERADRNARADSKASAARQEAEERHLSGVEMKDFFLAKAYEGTSVAMAQRGLEAQGFDLLEANENVNVYERPEGGRITMQLEGNKIKSADYKTPAETAAEGRAGNEPKPLPAASSEAAGIPKADEKTFVGKTFKDFSESARASGYKPAKEIENPDGSSSTFFSNGDNQIRVDFDKSGKITKVQKETGNPAASEEKKRLTNVSGQSAAGNYEAVLSRANPAQREVIEKLEEEMQMVSEEDLGKTQFRLLNRAYSDFQNSGDISKLKNVADILKRATGRNYHTEVLFDGEATDGEYTAESVNAPRENLERKLTGDCKIRIRK